MKSIKFTEKFLDKIFDDLQIEDDNLFDCLKDREGTIEESDEFFENEEGNQMVLNIKLKMVDM